MIKKFLKIISVILISLILILLLSTLVNQILFKVEKNKYSIYGQYVKVNNKEMNASDIENIYKSWRGSIGKYNSYHIVQNIDRLYYKLF